MLITFNVLKAFTEKVESLSTHQGKGDAVDAAVAWGHPSINLVAVPIHSFIYLSCKFKVFWGGTWRCTSYRYLVETKLSGWARDHLQLTFTINATSSTDFICMHILLEQPYIQQHACGIHQNTIGLLTPRSLPGQMPHADLGALPTFLVYRYTIRLPGVRDLQTNTEERNRIINRYSYMKWQWCL